LRKNPLNKPAFLRQQAGQQSQQINNPLNKSTISTNQQSPQQINHLNKSTILSANQQPPCQKS